MYPTFSLRNSNIPTCKHLFCFSYFRFTISINLTKSFICSVIVTILKSQLHNLNIIFHVYIYVYMCACVYVQNYNVNISNTAGKV